MITPFGRYRWARLLFVLKVSNEIFQRKLNEALEGLQGVFCVADDIVVVGCGESSEEAARDHGRNLTALQQRCLERDIKLNEEKASIKKQEIMFMGHCITPQGLKVDNNKVSAIIKMPPPVGVPGVKHLCGMGQYLTKFMPNLASDLEPIQALTHRRILCGTGMIAVLRHLK